MNAETTSEPTSIHEIAEIGRDKLALAREGANDALSATTRYIKENPWLAVVGAAAIGGLIGALSGSSKRPPSRGETIRHWLDDASSHLPSKRDIRDALKSSGLSRLAQQVSQKLHHH